MSPVLKVSCGKNRNVAPLTDKSALDRGKWSGSSPGRVIHTYTTWIHRCVTKTLPLRQGAGWAPEAVWELRWSENYFAPEGNRTPDYPARAVLSPLWQVTETHCYTAGWHRLWSHVPLLQLQLQLQLQRPPTVHAICSYTQVLWMKGEVGSRHENEKIKIDRFPSVLIVSQNTRLLYMWSSKAKSV